MQPRPWIPLATLLFSATFWGVVWFPLRLLEQHGLAGVWQTLVSYAAALLLILPFLKRGDPWRRDAQDVLLLAAAAGWCNLAFILAVLEGTVVRVLLLFYLSPVWAVLLGRWLLAERLEARSPLLLALAMAGTLLMLWDPEQGFPWPAGQADWLALSAGVTFALSNVLARRLRTFSLAGKTAVTWAGVVSVALLVIGLTGAPLPAVGPEVWGGAGLLGILGFFFATLAVLYGVTHMRVQRSSVILLFEIVAGAVSAAWLAGEGLNWREWVGGLLIIVAGYFMATWNTKGYE